MQRRNRSKPAVEAEATVHRVDPVNRELAAVVAGVLLNIYVPPDCAIVLRGERVKLRMIQPKDRLRVIYAQQGDHLIASQVEVQPGCPPSPLLQ